MTARPFIFASLLAVHVPLAHANPNVPIADVVEQPSGKAAAPIEAKWSTRVVHGELIVELTLVNTGTDAVDVLVSRGKLPGPWLQAEVDGLELERILTVHEVSDEASRMGPMPRYAPVAPGKSAFVGTWHFKLTPEQALLPVHLNGSATLASGSVDLSTTVPAACVRCETT